MWSLCVLVCVCVYVVYVYMCLSCVDVVCVVSGLCGCSVYIYVSACVHVFCMSVYMYTCWYLYM